MIWEFDFCANAFILFFWGSLEKLTTSVFKERQTETVRASFAKGSSLCPQSNQDGRGRTNIRRSVWSTLQNGRSQALNHQVAQQDVEHEEVQFSSHRRSVVSSAVSNNSHSVPWEDCRRDFLGGLPRVSPKLKRLAQGPTRKFSCHCRLVVRTSSTCLCWKRM